MSDKKESTESLIDVLKSIAKNKLFNNKPSDATLFMILVKYGFIHTPSCDGKVTCGNHGTDLRIEINHGNYKLERIDSLGSFGFRRNLPGLGFRVDSGRNHIWNVKTELTVSIQSVIEEFDPEMLKFNVMHNLLSQ